MASAWSGTIGQLESIRQQDSLYTILEQGFLDMYGVSEPQNLRFSFIKF
jgi:hypothetical protein